MTNPYPVPRLPNPLTEAGLRELMKQRPFWDVAHPQSELYRRAVEQGFKFLYPGQAKYDAIGKMITPEPRSSHEVAGEVAAFNQEMDRLEGMLSR
jgi:hypothetical protein